MLILTKSSKHKCSSGVVKCQITYHIICASGKFKSCNLLFVVLIGLAVG